MVESWWFQAMAQDGYARHGLHKHHVGCSAQGHGWRGQICQVFFFFFSDHAEDLPGWHLFFKARAYFSDLWKGNWPLFGWNDESGKHHRVDIPKVGETPPFVWGQTPQATKPWAVCKGHVCKRAIGKFTSLEFPQKNRRKWRDFRLGEIPILSHMYSDPWWSHIGVCGDHPKTVDRRNPARVWMARAPQSMGYLPHQLKCCKFCPSTVAGSTIWMCSLATQIWDDYCYPTLGKNRFRKISSKQRRK